jgi:hypothetical protein
VALGLLVTSHENTKSSEETPQYVPELLLCCDTVLPVVNVNCMFYVSFLPFSGCLCLPN